MMPPYSPFLFGGGHILQSNPTVGGWSPPSSIPNTSFTFSGSSAQMGGQFTSYIPSFNPSSSTSIPMNAFVMVNLTLASGVSSGGSEFYSMGNPLNGFPSSGGNIYPHMGNPYHVAFSSQAASLVMMPLQPFMNQFGGGYYHVEQGHGVYQNPAWLAISQNQSFPRPLSLMLQPVVASHDRSISPVIASHTGIISPTSTSHVGDRSTTSASHVENQQPNLCKSCWEHVTSHCKLC
jgi:hypothetical protein